MRTHILFLVCLVLSAASLSAQSLDSYTPLRAQGRIPTDFTTPSSTKFNDAKDKLKETRAESSHQAKEDFLLESSFLIDQVLASGRVLFNDPVSNYLSEILDTILILEPRLREQIRVYAVRSSVVNSFTTDNGIILVNLGLIAQLENEAQLAFILCHELVHFTEHHIINSYVQSVELTENKDNFKRGAFDETLLAKSRYSKDLEKEADRLGLDRFLKTGYSTATLANVFEVMRYAHLPFDDIPFDKSFFNRQYYRINESYFLQRVRPVEASESDTPNEASHPSPTERQKSLKSTLAGLGQPKGSEHLISAERFDSVRAMCRFELSDLYLKSDQPVLSIYNSFLLLRSHPENSYLQASIARALYTLSKFKSGGNFGQVHPGFSQIEGESQQLYHMFYRLKPDELCILATGHLWRLRSTHPHDIDLKRMSDDLLNDLMMKFHTPGMFEREKPPVGWDEPDTTEVQGKYDRLREKSKDNPKLTMIKYALVDLFDQQQFEQQFDSLERKRWGGAEPITANKPEEQKTGLKYWKNHGFALNAKKAVLVSPSYSKMDLRKRQQQVFLRSEEAKTRFVSQINRSAKLLNLELELLDRSILDSNRIDLFNDMAFLNEWVDQRFGQLDVGMINLPNDEIDRIIAKYGTEIFCWTGVINQRQHRPLSYFYLLYALIPPAIPVAVYYLARPDFDTYYYNITFNLRTGLPILINYNNYRKRDARDMINSSIYDSLWQMKRSQKPKQ